VASQTPADGESTALGLSELESEDGTTEQQMVNVLPIGEDYEKILGLKITQGRGFSSSLSTDVNNVLVNEALVKMMGWKTPIGKRVLNGSVVGVVKDFNFKSQRFRIEPLVIVPLGRSMRGIIGDNKTAQQRHLILDVTGADIAKVLSFVESVIVDADPKHPFEYRFLDDALDVQYKAEMSLTKLVGIFSGTSILIACMGLFGLTAFTTEQRSREIGTRKVLGATAWQIVGLLAKRILVLVMVAAVLASVVAYFAIDAWLTGFAYRANINPLIFVLSALAAGAVAFITVAAQSWRMANDDPVTSLRQV
jgi:putative ABC transport system permease protein